MSFYRLSVILLAIGLATPSCTGCGRALSVGDMKHLMPRSAPVAPPGMSSKRATQRLVEELSNITRSDPAKSVCASHINC